MPEYKVQGPDGRIYTIEGPEGASQDVLLRQAKRFYQQEQQDIQELAAEASQDYGILEQITGKERATEATKTLPSISKMPELQKLGSMDTLLGWAGLLFSNPQEGVQALRTRFPEIEARRDEKGNMILRSGVDAQEYAVKPGLQPLDLASFGATSALFGPASRASTVRGAAFKSGATQTGLEAAQAGLGGDFNPEEIGMSAVLAGASQGVSNLLGKPQARPQMSPAKTAASDFMSDAERAQSFYEDTLGKDIYQATTPMGFDKRQELAQRLGVDEEAIRTAEALGVDLPAVFAGKDPQLMQEVAGATDISGSLAEAEFRRVQSEISDKASKAFQDMDALMPDNIADVSSVSNDVKIKLLDKRNQLKNDASALYNAVDERVPLSTIVDLDFENTSALVNELDKLYKINRTKEHQRLQQITQDINTPPENSSIEVPGYRPLDFVSDDKVSDALDLMLSDSRNFKEKLVKREVTLGDMQRERQRIGELLDLNAGFADRGSDRAELKRFYGTLSEDIQKFISQQSPEAGEAFKKATEISKKSFEYDDKILGLFGRKYEEGSMAGKAKEALISRFKIGDNSKLKELINNVPKESRAQVVSTAIADQLSYANKADMISMQKFNTWYQAYKKNPEGQELIANAIGPGSKKIINQLGKLSETVAALESKKHRTGKANQAYAKHINNISEGMVSKAMRFAVGLGSYFVAARATGSAIGPSQGAANLGRSAFDRLRKPSVQAAGDLFVSKGFSDLIKAQADLASGIGQPARLQAKRNMAVKAMAKSRQFGEFMKKINGPASLDGKMKWIDQNLVKPSMQSYREQSD